MKNDFSFINTTKIYFGRNSLSNLTSELANYGENIMLAYGGGSIKKIGLYDEVVKILKDAGKNIIELSGIMPNPTYKKLLEGAKLVKENNVDLILAVGGGSVIDCAKGISASAYAKDPWKQYWIDREPVGNKVVPVASILTMVGTGSEMNGGSVITNEEVKIKIGRVFEGNSPKFSILNPEYTYTVSKYQMLSGIFDAMSHLMEQYFGGDDDNVSDDLIEALLKSMIKNTDIAIKNQQDYDARSNIMWISTLALNGLTRCSQAGDWRVHGIEHQIGAFTDCAHGMGLSAISPAFYRHIYLDGLPKFKRFAINVFNVCETGKTDEQIALEGIERLQQFIKEHEMVTSLRDLGVTDEKMLKDIADSIAESNNGYKHLSKAEIYEILKESY